MKTGRVILTLILSFLGLVILVPAIFLFLALQTPKLPWRDLDAGAGPLPLESAQFLGSGILVAPDAVARSAAALVRDTGVPGLGIPQAAGSLQERELSLGWTVTYTIPVEAGFLGGKTLKAYPWITVEITDGAMPRFRPVKIGLGWLSLPLGLFAQAAEGSVGDLGLPPGFSLEGLDLVVDLSQLGYEGIQATSLQTTPGGLWLGLDLPEGIEDKAITALDHTWERNADLLADEKGNPALAGMVHTLEHLGPLLGQPEHMVGQVAYLEGTASVTYGPEGMALALGIGDAIHSGATLHTEGASVLEVRMADQSLVRMDAGASLALDSVGTGASPSTTLDQVAGSVRYKVARLTDRSAYAVRTRVATMGVRGTEFVVDLATDGGVNLAVLEGTVAVGTSEADPLPVAEGKEVGLSPEGSAGTPKALSRSRRNRLEKAGFTTSPSVLESPFTPDPLAVSWTLIRQVLAWWATLPPEEQQRLADTYGSKLDLTALDSLAKQLGVDLPALPR